MLLALSGAQPRASQAGQEALVFCSSPQAQRPLSLQILVATRARSQVSLWHTGCDTPLPRCSPTSSQ